jgi:hypothetical protein
MTATALTLRKNKLLTDIALSESEGVIAQIEEILAKEAANNQKIRKINTGIRKAVTLEQMKKAQNYQGTSYQKINEIATAMDIEESVDELIAMI